jgi:PAS domain S-box-containing protein
VKKQPGHPGRAGELRRRAEHRLRNQPIRGAQIETNADAQRIFHELQVHEIELELQNEQLKQSKAEVDASLERYTDLYDFAPVGYFSVDERALILDVNLTGAALLGIERSRLTNRRFQLFVAPEGRADFNAFLERVFAEEERQTCEALLLSAGRASFWADLQAVIVTTADTAGKMCRMAVSDISARRQAEEAQRRIAFLAATNQKLDEEIIRRRATESALRESEAHAHQLVEQSHHTQKELQLLTRQLLVVQEEERKRISHELHDEVVQTLVGINVGLSALRRGGSVGDATPGDRFAGIQRLVADSIDAVHRFARGLRPSVLDDLGLIPALHAYCKSLAAERKLRIDITASRSVAALDETGKTVLFRVAQEALNNVANHARATKVKVSIREITGAIRMEISDNGRSFEVGKMLLAKNPKRLGLIGMKERLEMVGGSLGIESAPRKGTTVRAEIPITRAEP